jgi:pimeloyl-ACP methyl ester carboxylesterase
MPNSLPILIIGGFGSSWQQYTPLQKLLLTVSGRPVFIAPIALFDWVSVAASDDYSRLLTILDRAITTTLQETKRDQLVLLAHSAGGVLARMYLGDQPYGRHKLVFNGFQQVATLVTLGTPHNATRTGRQGGLNQIAFVQRVYPGAYWRFMRYVTIMSKGIFGVKGGTPPERGAWESYRMLTGEGGQWGDGVVPLDCGLLDGARHVILEELRHDPRPDRPWYGQDETTVYSWWHIVEETEREPTLAAQVGA